MGSIYKRGGIWYIDLYVRGRRIRKRVGRSKDVAKLALQDAEVKAARDEFGFTKNDIAIEKFLAQFMEYSEANNSPRTFTRYRAVLDHFNEFLKDHPDMVFMSQITSRLLDEYKVIRKESRYRKSNTAPCPPSQFRQSPGDERCRPPHCPEAHGSFRHPNYHDLRPSGTRSSGGCSG